MKVLKVVLAVVGIAGIVAAAVLLGRFALDSRELIGAAQRYTGNPIADPFMTTAMAETRVCLSMLPMWPRRNILPA